MANLTGVPVWSDVVQNETTTLVLGGAGGPMNLQAQSLANRTEWLKRLAQDLDPSGKHTIWVPAVAMYPSATSGAAWYSGESGPTLKGLAFDPATDEFAEFAIVFPKSWDESTLTAQFYWMTAVAEASAHDAIWTIQAKAVGDGSPTAGGFGSAVGVSDTTLNELTLRITPETSGMTVGGTPAETDWIAFKVSRDANSAGDTVVADAILLGVKLIFSTNAANDD